MTKNHLEKLFSASLKADSRFWGMKLHNNPLAHQNTPADYIISFNKQIYVYTQNSSQVIPIFQKHLILAECKQVTAPNTRLTFKRLKQLHDLLSFENTDYFHHSYVIIGFYHGGWTKESSEIYAIPANIMKEIIDISSKVSINQIEMKKYSTFKFRIVEKLLSMENFINRE